jgi:hypothetical protein
MKRQSAHATASTLPTLVTEQKGKIMIEKATKLRTRYYDLISPSGDVFMTCRVSCRSRKEVRKEAEKDVATFNAFRPGFTFRVIHN